MCIGQFLFSKKKWLNESAVINVSWNKHAKVRFSYLNKNSDIISLTELMKIFLNIERLLNALHENFSFLYQSIDLKTPSHFSNPIKGTGREAKKYSFGILSCTEMRGFTLTWSNSKIILDRLGVKVMFRKMQSFWRELWCSDTILLCGTVSAILRCYHEANNSQYKRQKSIIK